MGIPLKWQVDKELQQNLKTMKISTEIGNELDVNIRALMQEIDEKILSILLKKFVTKFLENGKAKEFGQFFEREYASPPSNMDVDYRRHAEIHTNYKLEAMLRILKSVHLKYVKIRRIDFSIFRLLKLCWDNLFNRLAYLNDEGDLYTLEILKDRHMSALSIPCRNITKNIDSFEVQSWSNRCITHYIELNRIECSCQLRCTECDKCLHVYTCNCIDYSLAGNFCKHVHAVCMYEKNLSPKVIDSNEDLDSHVEVVLSADDIPSTTTIFSTADAKDELIKTLLRMTHLLRTNTYTSEVYDKGAKFIREALNLFTEANDLESDSEESLNTLMETKIDSFSPKISKLDSSEIPSEPVTDELPDHESQILVDDVVEEVVYVDVNTSYDAFS